MTATEADAKCRQVRIAIAVSVVLFAVAASGRTSQGEEIGEPMRLARLVPEPRPEVRDRLLPRPLSDADASTYRRIFQLQEEGRFSEADQLIEWLNDPLLLGHVLAQRYLHSGYRARYSELRAWLERYADHPDAERIHALASKRRPKGAPPPREPVAGFLGGSGHPARSITEALTEGAHPPPGKAVRPLLERLKQLVRRGRADEARALLDGPVGKRHSAIDRDHARLVVARGLFFAGQAAAAFDLAQAVATASGEQLPLAHWIAGLSAWQLGRHADAARHFAVLARHERASADVRAGAAFWAARAHMVTGRPQLAARFFRLAADVGDGFYGLLARAILGDPIGIEWQQDNVDDDVASLIVRFPGSRRALALAQVGALERAEAEIRKLAARVRPRLLQALAALAERFELASAQMRVAQRLSALEGSRQDPALYPAPGWEPEGGLRVDRALLLALVRAETGFDADARSHRGARGLLQLMPETAARMAREAGIPYRGPADLADPAKNLAIGQAYLERLLAHPLAGRSLIHLAIAYNAGLSRLEEWNGRLSAFDNDPLMVVESIPFEETRTFVRKLLTNFWAYRIRFGQPVGSLEALAANDWPRYEATDTAGSEHHARANR